jgi:hypothetical protein
MNHTIIDLSAILNIFKKSFSMLFMLVCNISFDLLHILVSYGKFFFGGHLEFLRHFELFEHPTSNF